MIQINTNSLKPQINLAHEEYAVKNIYNGEDIVMLWQNEPSIIIGRNQNTIEEINKVFVKDRDINVVRRLSGGGAVYHDLGNINFTFITKGSSDNLSNFKKFTIPVINALKKLGVNAEFQGRNDIVVDSKKISGNAQYYYKNIMLHHGTLLFDANIEDIVNSLNVSNDKISSKSIKSVRSRVTNIKEYLKEDISVSKFINMILLEFKGENDLREYILNDKEKSDINELVDLRYGNWDWNYGKSPEFSFKNEKRFDGGKIQVLIDVKESLINNIEIFGDFFTKTDISNLKEFLLNKKYDKDEITTLLQNEWNDFFLSINIDDFIELMF